MKSAARLGHRLRVEKKPAVEASNEAEPPPKSVVSRAAQAISRRVELIESAKDSTGRARPNAEN
jgi:hypothetical protein